MKYHVGNYEAPTDEGTKRFYFVSDSNGNISDGDLTTLKQALGIAYSKKDCKGKVEVVK